MTRTGGFGRSTTLGRNRLKPTKTGRNGQKEEKLRVSESWPTVKRDVGSREPTRRRAASSDQTGNKAGIKRELKRELMRKGENVGVLRGS